MNEKQIRGAFSQKTDSSANWKIAGDKGFIPKKGEFIVYQEKDEKISNFKIGDGVTNVNDLEFATMEGKSGKSAYELARENGFQGSEQEWLDSLKGDEGPVGPQGPKGENGISPSVQIDEIEGGHRVIIADEKGDHSFDVMDGEDSDIAPIEFENIKQGNVITFEDVEDTQVVLSKVYGRSNVEDISSCGESVTIRVEGETENLVDTDVLAEIAEKNEDGNYIVSTPNLAKSFGFEGKKGLYEGPFKEKTPYTFSMTGSIVDDTHGFTNQSIWEQNANGEYVPSTKLREMYDNGEIDWCFEEAYGETLQGDHRGRFAADGSLYLNGAAGDWAAFRVNKRVFDSEYFSIDYLVGPNGAGKVNVYAFEASELENVADANKRSVINSKLISDNLVTDELSFHRYYSITGSIQHYIVPINDLDTAYKGRDNLWTNAELIIVLKAVAPGDIYSYMYPVGFSYCSGGEVFPVAFKQVAVNTTFTPNVTEELYQKNELPWSYLGGQYDPSLLTSLAIPQIMKPGANGKSIVRINSKVGEWHAFKFKIPAYNSIAEIDLPLSAGNTNMSAGAEFYIFPMPEVDESSNLLDTIANIINTTEPYITMNLRGATERPLIELACYEKLANKNEYVFVFKPILDRYGKAESVNTAGLYMIGDISIHAIDAQTASINPTNLMPMADFSLGKDTTGHTEYTYESLTTAKDKIAAAYDKGELNWKYLSSNDEKVETVEGYSSFQLDGGFQTLFNGTAESYIALEVNFATSIKKLVLDYIVGYSGGEFDFMIFASGDDFLDENGFIDHQKPLFRHVFCTDSDFISSFRKSETMSLPNELPAGKYAVVFNSWAGNPLRLIGLSITTENSTHYENYINFDLGRKFGLDFKATFRGNAFAYLPYYLDKRFELDMMNWRYETANERLARLIDGFYSNGSSTAAKQIQYSGGRLRCYFQANDWIAFEVKNPGIGAYRAGLNSESLSSGIEIYGLTEEELNTLKAATNTSEQFESLHYDNYFGTINAAGKIYGDWTVTVLDKDERFFIVLRAPEQNTAFLKEFMFAGQVYDLNLGSTILEAPVAYFQYNDDTIDQVAINSINETTVSYTTNKNKTLTKVFLGQKYGSIKEVTINQLSLIEGNAPYAGMSLTFAGLNAEGLQGIPVNEGGNFTDENGQMWLSDIMDCENQVYIQNVHIGFIKNPDELGLPYIKDEFGFVVCALPEPVIVPFSKNDIAQLSKVIELGENNIISVSDNHFAVVKYYDEENPLPRKLSSNEAGKFLGINDAGMVVPMEVNIDDSQYATQSQITNLNSKITNLTNKHNNDIANISSLGMQCDLLWKNASSSTFVDQSIQLPETQYKLYAIDYSQNGPNYMDQQVIFDTVILIPNYSQSEIWAGNNLVDIVDLYYREVILEEGYKLNISSCTDIQLGSTYNEYDNYCVPSAIYGIK